MTHGLLFMTQLDLEANLRLAAQVDHSSLLGSPAADGFVLGLLGSRLQPQPRQVACRGHWIPLQQLQFTGGFH